MFPKEKLVEILTALPDPAFLLTRSGRYAGVFGGADSRYYHDGSGLVGMSIAEVLSEEKTAWFLNEIEETLSKRQLRIIEYSLARSDVKGLPDEGPEGRIYFEGRVQPLGFQIGGEDVVLWVASNITNRFLLEEQLRALSETDTLTGLWNRRHFQKMVDTEKERARRYGSSISLLIFDIDFFKVINDTYGHNAGDAVLSEVAKVVRESTRESDVVTRWGGEEFTILMPHAPLEASADVAEKIRRKVESHAFPHGYKVTISLGVAEWDLETESFETLLSRADEALYQAKSGGRNRSVVSYPEVPMSAGKPMVSRLLWRSRYECGNEVIDRQHQALFEGTQSLLATTAGMHLEGSERWTVSDVLPQIDRLMSEAVAHFDDEERILHRISWPGLVGHQAEHSRLKNQAQTLRHQLQNSSSKELASELVKFLAVDIVANHMLRLDRQFFPVVRDASSVAS